MKIKQLKAILSLKEFSQVNQRLVIEALENGLESPEKLSLEELIAYIVLKERYYNLKKTGTIIHFNTVDS